MKRILIVYDEPGWIFERHAKEIQKRLTEYHIDLVDHRKNISEMSADYDVIYVMDPMPMFYPRTDKTIMGLRCEFLIKEHPEGARGLYEKGFPGRCVAIKPNCCMLHVVNRNQFSVLKDIVTDKPLLLAQHGIDEEVFDRSKYKKAQNECLVVGVVGRNSNNKNFDLIKDACMIAGKNQLVENKVGFFQAQYGNRRVPKEKMPQFYCNIDVLCCASLTEGLSNPIMEAGAMGIPVITTDCGAVREMIKDGVSGLIVERHTQALVDAINKLKDKELRLSMGNKFHEEIMKNWTWKVRIEDFRKMFGLYFGKEDG